MQTRMLILALITRTLANTLPDPDGASRQPASHCSSSL